MALSQVLRGRQFRSIAAVFPVLISLIFLLPRPGYASVTELIRHGQIDAAREELAKDASATRRNGEILLGQGMLESDGPASLKFLEAALKTGTPANLIEDNVYLMMQYYQAARDYNQLLETSRSYLQRWENGKYRSQAQRYSALALMQTDKGESANRFLENLIQENKGESAGLAGEIDRAVYQYKNGEVTSAQKISRRLADGRRDEAVVPALYLMTWHYLEQGRVDEAILYYNLLKEGYPLAVGLDDLVERFGKVERRPEERLAEEITGTVYSIQVGVFSSRENARKYAEGMKKYGEKVEIKDKTVSDKKYSVVYVGRFSAMAEALAFKTRLESAENAAFQIITR